MMDLFSSSSRKRRRENPNNLVAASKSMWLFLELLLLIHPSGSTKASNAAFLPIRPRGFERAQQITTRSRRIPILLGGYSNYNNNNNFYDSKATESTNAANTFAPSWEISEEDPSLNEPNAKSSSSSSTAANTTATPAAPLYITIGPPCGGKTAALRATLERDGYDADSVLDVALDEMANTAEHPLFVRIPLAVFLFPHRYLTEDNSNNDTTTRATAINLGNRVLASGVTLRDRLCHPQSSHESTADEELRQVLLRVAGRVTAEDFARSVRRMARQAGDTVSFFRQRRQAVAEDLIMATEQASVQAVGEVLFQREVQAEPVLLVDPQTGRPQEEIQEELPYSASPDEEQQQRITEAASENSTTTTNTTTSAHLLSARALIQTPQVQLFVPHAMFSGGGIQEAMDELEAQLAQDRQQPVAWGNTNTRPLEFAAALKAAQGARRRVHFVAWGASPFMPRVSRAELLRRNIARFRRTGRYIPSGAVGASLERVERLVQQAAVEAVKQQQQWKNIEDYEPDIDNNDNRHAMDQAFASLAGFLMDDRGYVIQVDEPRDLNPPNRTFRSTINTRNKTRNGRHT